MEGQRCVVFGGLGDVECNELLVHAADVDVDGFSVLSNADGTPIIVTDF